MNKLKLYGILFIFNLILFATNVLGQSSILNRTITISIVNKRFDIAVKLIEEEGKINFCYNSDIIPKNKVVTVKANHNRLDKVLIPLLASVDLQMKELNNQIIITKSDPSISGNAQPANSIKSTPTNQQKTEISGKVVTIVDTIVHTLHDTIVKTVFDTIRITVYDTKIIRQSSKSLSWWAPKLSIDFSGAMMYQIFNHKEYTSNSEYHSFFTQYGAIEKSKHGYSFAGNVSLKNKRAEISIGIEYFKALNNININDMPKSFTRVDSSIIQTRITPQGIFYDYKVDTVSLLLDYLPNQTTMHYTYSYIGFPIILSYKVIETKKIAIGLNLGIIYSRLLNAKGFDAGTNGNTFLKNTAGESLTHENVSMIAGFEIEYPLNKYLSLTSSVRLRKSLTSTYLKSFPMLEKPSYIYPLFSIKYHF